MPFILRNLTLDPGADESLLPGMVSRRLGLAPSEIISFRLVRKGVDARKKGRLKLVYTVEFSLRHEARVQVWGDLEAVAPRSTPRFPTLTRKGSVVIVGMGPAGLFAGLRLAEYGLNAVILE